MREPMNTIARLAEEHPIASPVLGGLMAAAVVLTGAYVKGNWCVKVAEKEFKNIPSVKAVDIETRGGEQYVRFDGNGDNIPDFAAKLKKEHTPLDILTESKSGEEWLGLVNKYTMRRVRQ